MNASQPIRAQESLYKLYKMFKTQNKLMLLNRNQLIETFEAKIHFRSQIPMCSNIQQCRNIFNVLAKPDTKTFRNREIPDTFEIYQQSQSPPCFSIRQYNKHFLEPDSELFQNWVILEKKIKTTTSDSWEYYVVQNVPDWSTLGNVKCSSLPKNACSKFHISFFSPKDIYLT